MNLRENDLMIYFGYGQPSEDHDQDKSTLRLKALVMCQSVSKIRQGCSICRGHQNKSSE